MTAPGAQGREPLPGTYTSHEVADMLQCSHRWVLDQARLHPDRFPSLRVGRLVRFTRAQVEVIVAGMERRPDPKVVAAVEQETDGWGRPALAVLREQRRRG